MSSIPLPSAVPQIERHITLVRAHAFRSWLMAIAGVAIVLAVLPSHRSASSSSARHAQSFKAQQVERSQQQGERYSSGAPALGTATVSGESPAVGSLPVLEKDADAHASASSAGALSSSLPLREASDSGRAQPVFIALRAPQAVLVGQPFSVDITGESENDFARVTLAVKFDPVSLRVAGVRKGDLMARVGATAALSYAVDAQAGRVSIELGEGDAGGLVSGGGTLCSVEFVATASGRTPLSITDVAVGDLNNEGVAYAVLPPAVLDIR